MLKTHTIWNNVNPKKMTIKNYCLDYVNESDGPISHVIAHKPKTFDHLRLLVFLHVLGMR